MNREILFRGKRLDNGEWVKGYYRRILCLDKHDIFPENPKNRMESHTVDPDTVCQYTGLNDRNGVKIFEGNIVEFEDAEADYEGYHDNVFTNRGSVSICPYSGILFSNRQTVDMDDLYMSDVTIDARVIGNLFDNAELLEGGEEKR